MGGGGVNWVEGKGRCGWVGEKGERGGGLGGRERGGDGLKLDEMASSEHLRKPKKARINMASSVWGGVDGMITSTEGGNAFG